MKTNDFFEDLQKYFENTPRTQVMEDWSKSEKLDEVGPTVEEFLNHTKRIHHVHLKDPASNNMNFKNINTNPEFTSGFLFYKQNQNGKSIVFN